MTTLLPQVVVGWLQSLLPLDGVLDVVGSKHTSYSLHVTTALAHGIASRYAAKRLQTSTQKSLHISSA